MGALEEKFFERLCAVVGRPELAERQYDSDQESLAAVLSGIFSTRRLGDWLELFDAEDVCVGPVATLAEAAGELGGGPAQPPPALGEHTDAWRRELGLETAK